MKNFYLKILLFSLPVIALFAFPFTVFVMSREYVSLRSVVARQIADPKVLYLSGFTSETDRPYKFLSFAKRNPEVTVLGTSRTLTFKSDFFKNPKTFYNAGYNANSTLKISDLDQFVKNIPEKSNLKIILFDVSNYLTSSSGDELNSSTYNPWKLFFTTGWRTIYSDYLRGNIPFGKLVSAKNRNIGLTAVLHSQGYSADGSLDRGTLEERLKLAENVPQSIANELALIDAGNEHSIDFGTTIQKEKLDVIDDFLAECKKRGIYVIGYLSPYSTEIYQKMNSLTTTQGDMYRQVPGILRPVFEKEGFHFYDVRDLTLVGSSDAELYDAEHPDESSTQKLLRYLGNKEKKLAAFVL